MGYYDINPGSYLLSIEAIVSGLSFVGIFIACLFIFTGPIIPRSKSSLLRKINTNKWDLLQVIVISILLIWGVVIIGIHINAFLTVSKLDLNSDNYDYGSNPITIFNWPHAYTLLTQSPYDSSYTWPFLSLVVTDIIATPIVTIIVIFTIVLSYVFSRNSKDKKYIRQLSKIFLFTTLLYLVLSIILYIYINASPEGRTIFIIISLIVSIALPTIYYALWKPLLNRLFTIQEKTFSERMKDLTRDFTQISSASDSILEEMRQALEIREQEVNSRESRLTLIEQKIIELSKQEDVQQKRVEKVKNEPKEVIEAITEYIDERLDPNLNQRDNRNTTIGIIISVVSTIVGLVLAQELHILHIWIF